MSKSRDIADSAATINYIDNVTSNVQTQLNTLDTALDNISVTSGTLTKTFTTGESSTINLTSSVLAPVVSVTKEVPQSGVTNNSWDVNSTTENYTRLDSAAATTLDFVANDDVSAATETSITLSGASESASMLAGTIGNDGQNAYMLDSTSGIIYQYSLATAYDLSSGSYESKTFDVSSQQSDPRNFFFKSDGTKLYVIGTTSQATYQYSLSTAWDISTASYDSKTFSASAQSNGTSGLFIKPDGSKLYIVAYSNDAVYQYSLSTAWDISTASYDSVSLSVSGQDSTPRDITFNDDGTVLYMCGTGNNALYQYNLTTAYDLSSASYSSNTLSLDTTVFSVTYSSASLQLVIFQSLTDILKTVRLSNTLSLGTGSFASADVGKTIEANSGVFVLTDTGGSYIETTAPTSYDQVASGDWSMYGVVYNAADGDLQLSSGIISTVNTLDAFGDSSALALYQLDGNANDIGGTYNGTWTGTAAYTTGKFSQAASFNGSSHIDTGVSYNPSNTVRTMSFWVNTSTSQVGHISVLESGTASGLYFNGFVLSYWINNGIGYSTGFTLTSGTWHNIVWVIGNSTLKIYADNTLLINTSVSVNNSTHQIVINSGITPTVCLIDQYRIFNKELSSDEVSGIYTEGAFSTPSGYHPVHTTASTDTTYWTDINSMTADQAAGDGNVYYAISTDDRTTWTVIDNTDGERDIVRNNAGTWQYNSNGTYASETWVNGTTNTELATLAEAMEGAVGGEGYSLANASYSQNLSLSSQTTTPRAISFNSDGSKMFIAADSEASVLEYNLSTDFDISTSSYSQSFSVSSQLSNAEGLSFNTSGTKMFVLGGSGDSVYEYTLSTGFDVSTASFVDSFSVASQEGSPFGITFSPDGAKMFVVGSGSDAVNEYTLSTAFDISTASYSQNFSVEAEANTPTGIAFSSDGTQMFVVGFGGDVVSEYILSTGFDVSTASYSQNLSVASQDQSPRGLTFNSDGSKMFVIGDQSDVLLEYSTDATAYLNQMDKTQLDAVTDPNHIALGNDLDLAIVFNMTSGTTVPSSDGVAINYDATVLNKGAVLGTDYDFDAPAQDKVRITALAGNNLKVRVV